jgi:flagellar motor protein MotB
MMLLRYFIIVLLLLFRFAPAQIAKADRYFSQNRLNKAIPLYLKASKKPELKQDAYLKLAECYRMLNEYEKAETAYASGLSSGTNANSKSHYNYAGVLKTNGKYTQALEQYNLYIKQNPSDAQAKKAQKFVAEIKYWLSRPIEYQVKNVESINTEAAEFCPVYHQGKLLYVAERESFDFVEFKVNDYNGQPFMNMFISDINKWQAGRSKSLSKRVNSDAHDGPAVLSADGNTLCFTRTRMNVSKGEAQTAGLYFAKGKNRSWKNIEAFEYNSKEYSVAHPALSADGNWLFFASDMPGGFGGKDIWVCKRNGNSWEKPQNLGPDINTSGSEMFPVIKSNGMLYFSSDGLPGYGGLDIYSAKNIEGKWILNRNEGLSLNSSFDDFGITFVNDTSGYFSSNRPGGKGKDDIYYYTYTDKSMMISGTVLLTENSNDPAKNVEVTLQEENGNNVGSTRTNEKGYFEFKNLDAEKKYMAIIDNSDPQFAGKARYYLADGNNIIQRVTNKNGKDKFVFKNLPFDPKGLPEMYTDDDLRLAGNLLFGENPSKPLKNTKLKLVNDFGDVIEETTTNEFGAFTFRNIPGDQNYLITMDESDTKFPERTKITLTNKSGKELKSFYTSGGKMSFKIISSEKALISEMNAGDDDLIMEIFGFVYDENRKPVSNAKLRLIDEANPSSISEIVTGASGKFNFRNLRADKVYIFEADESDPVLSGLKKIFIADNKGRIYKVISKDGAGKFTFKVIEADKALMGEFVVDDPWLAVLEMKNKKEKEALTIIENIYYEFGDFKFDAAGQKVLDKVISILQSNQNLVIELSSHTDSRSSDQFNMALSVKRAQYAVNYMVSKGINKKRLMAVGYGETRLLNKCVNNIECSEEEHKVNRRTEFKITESTLK